MTIHHLQLWVPSCPRRSLVGLAPRGSATSWRTWEHGRVWRKDATGIVIEASPDMVPGMLHSRLRPGMNHVAFAVDSTSAVAAVAGGARTVHGWQRLSDDPRHPLPKDLHVAYLEDRDGFEGGAGGAEDERPTG
ncbi:MAG: hypothetical protein U0P45_04815 [Acidimicrobiales bacterium]